jgi:hypothetical protein
MDIAQSIGVIFGSSWASGVNLYLTTALLGIAERLHWIALPGDLKIVSHPLIILAAIALFAIQFVADKVPLVDHAWDAIHAFILPVAGAAVGYLAMANLGPVAQTLTGLVTGGIATSSHLTKSSSKGAVNATMVPGAGIAASTAADASVCGMVYFIIQHPIIAGLIVIAFVVFAVWFLRKMFGFIKKLFSFGSSKDKTADAAAENNPQ